MNFGLNPHWGAFINDWKVGDWTNFAVNQGFGFLEFTVDVRMLGKGLSRIFDRRVVNAFNHARRRGLKFHVALGPYGFGLGQLRARIREEGTRRLYQVLKFLANTVRPDFVILHPEMDRSGDRRGIDWLIDDFKQLQDSFPDLRLGLKIGGEKNLLKTSQDVWRVSSRLREVDFCLDIGWAFMASGDDLQEVGRFVRSARENLFEMHWHNFTFRPLRRQLPLGEGYLGESHYIKVFSFLPPRREIWHTLDYRDRSRKNYPQDRLTLEELSFRSDLVRK